MSQYRTGTFVVPATPVAMTLNLGFVPDVITVWNVDDLEVNPPNDATAAVSFWLNVMPSGSASQTIYTAGVPAVSYITSNGFTPVVLGGDWQNTQYVVNSITNASPGVVTVAAINPTNSLVLVNGMTVTMSGINGMTGVNGQRFIVSQLTIVGGGPTYTFKLYDLFGNPFSTVGLGTMTTSTNAEINEISYPATAPVLDPTTGQVVTTGQPAGNQFDIGFEGIILGTSVVGDAGDTMFWEAKTMTPTGW